MGNWSHENHDRRVGGGLMVSTNARGESTTVGTSIYYCFDCRESGFTLEDISHWPKFSEADYERHAHWIDPQWYAMTHEENTDGR